MDAVEQRFVKAVEALAVGTESIQERVSSAWTELMPLSKNDFPSELQAYFEVVESEMLNAPEDPGIVETDAAIASAERVLQLAFLVWSVTKTST